MKAELEVKGHTPPRGKMDVNNVKRHLEQAKQRLEHWHPRDAEAVKGSVEEARGAKEEMEMDAEIKKEADAVANEIANFFGIGGLGGSGDAGGGGLCKEAGNVAAEKQAEKHDEKGSGGGRGDK